MKISIVSERQYSKFAYWDVVYEWEDVFAEYFEYKEITGKVNLVVRKIKDTCLHKYPKLFNFLFLGTRKFRCDGKSINLSFVMNANSYRLYTQKNNIPIFLDFPYSAIDDIIIATEKIPVFFVTCYDIYKEMLKRNCKNVRFIPLSISDKYYSKQIPTKEIDVIQFGRKNETLHNYMLEYCKTHNNVDYVYQKDGQQLTYFSTQKGDLGRFDTRKAYFEFMSKCKVSLVSSPAIEGKRNFGPGVDFITPRFYESAVNYCYMLGRYTENEEANILNIASVCENIKSYEQFEECLDKYLESKEFSKKTVYDEFIEKNITSERCKVIKEQILNIQNK